MTEQSRFQNTATERCTMKTRPTSARRDLSILHKVLTGAAAIATLIRRLPPHQTTRRQNDHC